MTWFLFSIFIILSFLFSGIEAGLLSVNRVRLRHYALQGSSAAIRLQRLLENPERIISTVLIVTNICNISAVVILARECVLRWGKPGYLMTLIFSLPLLILFTELLPKSLFRRFSYRLSIRFVPLLNMAHLVFSPVLNLFGFIFGWAIPHRAMRRRRLLFAVPELKTLTAESERFGVFSGEERRLIDGVIDFRFVKARDIMIPLKKVVSVSENMTTEEAIRLGRTKKIDRLPVVSGTGKLIGVITVKEVLLDSSNPKTVADSMRRILQIASETDVYSLIRTLSESNIYLAGVVDKQGESVGIVSLEDAMLRLVKSAA